MMDFIIGSMLLVILTMACHQLLKPHFLAWQRRHRYAAIIYRVQWLYRHHNPYAIAREASANLKDCSYVYGEVMICTLLDLLAILSPTAQDVFYDLGSGVGKGLFAAKLRYPTMTVNGIEKLPALHAIAENLAKQNASHPINTICADFIEWDFSDASILFINATAFSVPLWDALLKKLLALKPKTKIIITSKPLPEKAFLQRYAGMEKMSWGLCSTYIYEKR